MNSFDCGNEVIEEIEKAIDSIKIKPLKACYGEVNVRINVLGEGTALEILSTVNSIVSVAKFIVPLFLIETIIVIYFIVSHYIS